MVASWYSISTGAGVTPKVTSKSGKTPDSRSKIIQPSVRTVSLTQNGIRHSTNNSALVRPRTSLAIVQAMGNAMSKVMAVARIDMMAVRTKVCQYSGSSTKVRYCDKLGSYTRGATRARSDKIASSIWGKRTSPTSHTTAGASSSIRINRVWS